MPIVKQIKTPFGTIRIMKYADDTLAYYQNNCFHSQADKNGVSICAYIHAIYGMAVQAKAKNVLIIGCGGGTLATMLSRRKCKVTVVDINPAAFIIARDYFKLPRDVRCIEHDGITFLRKTQKSYDAIIVDVFGSNNTVPACFTTKQFFQSVQQALSPSGLMVMNWITHDDYDKRIQKVACHAQAMRKQLRLFDWPHHLDRNTLILAGGPARLKIPTRHEPDSVTDDFSGMICRRLKRIS